MCVKKKKTLFCVSLFLNKHNNLNGKRNYKTITHAQTKRKMKNDQGEEGRGRGRQ